MEVLFFAQGLGEGKDKTAGEQLISALSNSEYKIFRAFVAFVSKGGIDQIIPAINDFKSRGGIVQLFIGVDLHGTSKEALESLLEHDIDTYIVHSDNRIVYHPKLFTFEGKSTSFVLIGSSNMTTSGLYQNIEANVGVISNLQEDGDHSFLSDIYDYYNSIIIGKNNCCKKLNRDIINLLLSCKIVYSEKESRSINNKISKEAGIAKAIDLELLKRTFKKVKVSVPRNIGKRTIRQEIVEKGEDDNTVFTEAIDICNSSIWIETREMTGGSRNILDLSKKGRRNEEVKAGSVEFFGVDKENEDLVMVIDILYAGKLFAGNDIFYAKGNSNWRIRLNGVAPSGEKLTDISLPKLGKYGGFQKKILVFERTPNTSVYNMYILPEEEIEDLKSISSDWAYGGNGNGRAYGFID